MSFIKKSAHLTEMEQKSIIAHAEGKIKQKKSLRAGIAVSLP